MRNSLKAIGALALAATLAAGLTSGHRAVAQEMTKMTVAFPPVAAYLPIIAGIDKGIYKEAGLELSINPDIVGAQLIPAVLSGDVQVAGNIWPFVALAGSQGLPIKTVSALAAGGTTVEDDDQQLVVLASTDIKTSADLAGKTVAINTLNGLSEFGVRAIARNEGADADAIKVTPVLFPNMLGVLRAGSVDAAAMIEPFLTLAKQEEDIRVIGGINVALQSESPTGIMVMSNDYIEKNPDVVARFQAATKKAVAYTADEANRAEIVQLLIKYTRTPPDIAEKMTLPRFVDHHDIAKVQDQIDLYVKAGVIEKELDMSEFDAQAPAQ